MGNEITMESEGHGNEIKVKLKIRNGNEKWKSKWKRKWQLKWKLEIMGKLRNCEVFIASVLLTLKEKLWAFHRKCCVDIEGYFTSYECNGL